MYARGDVYVQRAHTQAVIAISYIFFIYHPTNNRTIYLLTMHVDTISGYDTQAISVVLCDGLDYGSNCFLLEYVVP